jgi:signal transduction histidine kinase
MRLLSMRRSYAPYLVLAATLLLSALAAWFLADSERAHRRARFDNAVQGTHDRLETRLNTQITLLRGVAGLFAASDTVTRQDFHQYVSRLSLPSRYPGIQGIGFSPRVAPPEGANGVPRVAGPGDPQLLYLEPLDARFRMGLASATLSEPSRLASMAWACDHGEPALTGPLTLVPASMPGEHTGFLLFLPIYHGGEIPPTVQERRRLLQGFVFSPGRAEDLFRGIYGGQAEPLVSFRLYDGTVADPAHLIYDSRTSGVGGGGERAAFHDTIRVAEGGRPWTLVFDSRPVLEQWPVSGYSLGILLAGLLVGVALFGTVKAQALATDLAERATAEVRVSLAERERLAEREHAARAAAEASNRAKSRFLATMSHELRTPLNAISGYTELLEMGIQGELTEGQREYLDRIRASQQHLLGLINDILDFARLEAGRLDYHPAVFPVAPLVAEVQGMVEPQASEKGLVLRRGHRAPDATVLADPDRARQILLNLVHNAIKFTPPGGAVTVSWHLDGSVVRIEVADTGPGIPAEHLASVFEPFVQLDSELNRQAPGTGLGLAISRELARSMGGDLTATSEPGKGSVFRLSLVRAEAEVEPREVPDHPQAEGGGG